MIKIWEDTTSSPTRVTPLQLSQGRATKPTKQRGNLAVSVSLGQIQQLVKRKKTGKKHWLASSLFF